VTAVWLRNIFLKTLGDCRLAVLGWGLSIGSIAPLIFALIPTLLADSDARASVAALVKHPAMRLFGEPVDVLTPGGYATWRLALILPLVGVWALLITTRALRGEEESGALDLLLSMPRSRLHVTLAKLGAIGAAILLIGSLIGLLAFAGGLATATTVSLSAALLFGLNTALLAGVFGACALLASQFMTERRSAAGLTGALLGVSLLMVSVGRLVPGREWIGWLSPLYYFERSKPLVTGVDPQSMLVLAGVTSAVGTIAVALFLRRDIGGQIRVGAGDRADTAASRLAPFTGSPLLRSVFTRSLGALAVPIASWGLGLAVYTGAVTAILQQAQSDLLDLVEAIGRFSPMYAELVAWVTGGRDGAMNARSLTAVFTLVAAMFSVFAITLASRWAVDDEDGRFDLLLATPHPRHHVMLARFAALSIGLLIVAGLIFTSTGLTAWLAGFALDRARLAEAAFGLVPIGVVVAAAGYLLAGWLHSRSVTGILTGLLLISFVVTLLGPLFRWPTSVMQLSIFEQYGTPLVTGLQPVRVAGLLAVAAALLTGATARFATRDLVR
jgi:ABC-2 type transport system permease protein